MNSSNTGKVSCNVQLIHDTVREYTADKRPATKDRYTRFVNKFVNFCCARWDCAPEEIDFANCTILQIGKNTVYMPIQSEVINEFFAQLPYPSNRLYANRILYVIFNLLREAGILEGNPVPKPQYSPSIRKQGLTFPQIEQLALILMGFPEPYRTAYIIALSAGLRPYEVCSLRVSDIAKENGNWIIAICREALKGRRAWVLPLPELSYVIESYMHWRNDRITDCQHFIVSKEGNSLSTLALWERLKTIKIPGVERNITPYDLRRAYATLMDRFVENPEVLVRAMRHRTTLGDRVTRGYVRQPTKSEIKSYCLKLPVVELAESLAALWLVNKSK